MNEPTADTATPSFNLEDVYYVLLRHKWLVLFCSLAGVGAAAYLYLTSLSQYRSEAKLLVRYVMDSAALNPNPADSSRQIKFTDLHGDKIIDSEIEILTSWDLIESVVDAVGPGKIVAAKPGRRNAAEAGDRTAAVRQVLKGVSVEIPRRSSVMMVRYEHPNPQMAQQVLHELIDRYLQKHHEIHRAVGAYDFLQQQTDQLRARLQQTEEELRKLKSQAGVISIEDAQETVTAQIHTFQQDIFAAETELAQNLAKVRKVESMLKPEAPGAPAPSAPAARQEYQNILERLNLLRRRELELLGQFTEKTAPVVSVRQQIRELAKRRSDLEEKDPTLALSATLNTNAISPLNLAEEKTAIIGLEARLQTLTAQLEKMRGEAARLDSVENAIVQLQRKRDLEEANFRYFSQSLEHARIDTALDSGKSSNISIVQAPSLGLKNPSGLKKKLLTAMLSGVTAGIALAFLLEFAGVRTVKRPGHVASELNLPLFLTVPFLRRQKGRWKFRIFTRRAREQPQTPVVALERRFRQPCELLRDRVVALLNGARKRPRLVGLTGCSSGAGVTSLATGLATTLSEEVDGCVLSIRITGEGICITVLRHGQPVDQSAHFADGRPQRLLPYFADVELPPPGENGDQVPDAQSPRGVARAVTDLILRLRDSEYDYVVFDLPPESESGLAFRLNPELDTILLVVQAEKTSFDLVRHTAATLQASNRHFGVVLNKNRKLLPPWVRSGA